MRSLWKFFTSLRLTVACLAIGLLIVFFGTLAQVDEGLWNAQDRWFRSYLIWWNPQHTANWLATFPRLASSASWLHADHFFSHWRLPILPGGYTVGIVLLLNLLAAHISRFQWTWRKLGIHLTHAGVILLLVGQLTTDMLSREGVMGFREGETKSFSQSQKETELVFASDFEGKERVISIPGDMVKRLKEITNPQLPCTVRVLHYQPNSDIFSRTAVSEAATTLMTAMATMEAKYSMPDALPVQAEEAQESAGRSEVFADALEAVGEGERPRRRDQKRHRRSRTRKAPLRRAEARFPEIDARRLRAACPVRQG